MAGDLAPGTQLPSTQQLVAEYQVANDTVQKAVRALKTEGFLRTRRGAGVYVRDRQTHRIRVGSYFEPEPGGYSSDLLQVAQDIRPPREVASELQLPPDGRAVLRQRLLRHDGEPVELDYSYYPVDLAAGTDLASRRKIRGGAPRVLSDLGHAEHHFVDRVSVRMPTSEEIELLELPDVPVLRQFRVVYSLARPVSVSVLIKGGHLYELLYRQPIS